MPAPAIAFFDETAEPEEWAHAWNALVSIAGAPDYEEEHHTSGERWQYMGSEPEIQNAAQGRWVHTFRHRDHPRTGRRELVRVPATWAWTRRQIDALTRATRAAVAASDRAATASGVLAAHET